MNKKTYTDIPMSFGKYRGFLVADLPDSYLNYLLDQDFVQDKYPEIRRIAKMEKDYRKKWDVTVEDK